MEVVIVEGKWAVLGVNLGRPNVTNGNGDALCPNYFGEDLLPLGQRKADFKKFAHS